MLVSTRGFKNALCHSRSVLVSAHCFKNELLLSVARTKLNFKKNLESFLSLPSIFGYLGKETKNTAKHVIMNKIFIYARAWVNKDFVHSDSIGGQARAVCYNPC